MKDFILNRDERKFGPQDDPSNAYSQDAYLNPDIKETKRYKVTSNTTLSKIAQIETENLVIISGSGPCGLMDALVAKKKYPKKTVLITEKRERFSRRNLATIQKDTYSFLKKMGVYKEIIRKSDRIHKTVTGASNENEDDVATLDILAEIVEDNQVNYLDVDENFEYSVDKFKNDDKFFATGGRILRICDLQEILFEHCLKMGIKTLKKTFTTVDYCEESGTTSVKLRKKGKEIDIIEPFVVVIAEGIKSRNVINLCNGWNCGLRQEFWTVSNIEAECQESFKAIVKPKKVQTKRTITSLYSQTHQEIALTECYHVGAEQVESMNANKLSLKDTNDMGDLFKISTNRLKWNSSFFTCQDKIAKKLNVGERILISGDSAGGSSPIAGMGVSLAISAHPFALEQYFLEREDTNIEKAFENYEERVKSYIFRWQRNANLAWDQLGDTLLVSQM